MTLDRAMIVYLKTVSDLSRVDKVVKKLLDVNKYERAHNL